MAIIVIKDLADSVDLDRQAMAAITGGARVRAPHLSFDRQILAASRIVSYPAGFAHNPLANANGRFSGTTPPLR